MVANNKARVRCIVRVIKKAQESATNQILVCYQYLAVKNHKRSKCCKISLLVKYW